MTSEKTPEESSSTSTNITVFYLWWLEFKKDKYCNVKKMFDV